jgi:hypothetical protein
MPTWGQLLQELQTEQQRTKQLPYDAVRRKYMFMLHGHTGRNTILYILYATKWTQPANVKPELISITEEDVQGLMEVVFELKTPRSISFFTAPADHRSQLKRSSPTFARSSRT